MLGRHTEVHDTDLLFPGVEIDSCSPCWIIIPGAVVVPVCSWPYKKRFHPPSSFSFKQFMSLAIIGLLPFCFISTFSPMSFCRSLGMPNFIATFLCADILCAGGSCNLYPNFFRVLGCLITGFLFSVPFLTFFLHLISDTGVSQNDDAHKYCGCPLKLIKLMGRVILPFVSGLYG